LGCYLRRCGGANHDMRLGASLHMAKCVREVSAPKWIVMFVFFMDSTSYGEAVDVNPIDVRSQNLFFAELLRSRNSDGNQPCGRGSSSEFHEEQQPHNPYRSDNHPHALCHGKDQISSLTIMEPPHLRE